MATGWEIQLYQNVDRIAKALERIATALEAERAVVQRLVGELEDDEMAPPDRRQSAYHNPTEEEQSNANQD